MKEKDYMVQKTRLLKKVKEQIFTAKILHTLMRPEWTRMFTESMNII